MIGQDRKWYKVLLHIAGWLLFLSWPFLFDTHNPNRQPMSFTAWLPMIVGNIALLGFFYLNILVLIPKILRKRGWTSYLGVILICFLSYSYTYSALRDEFFPRRPFRADRNLPITSTDAPFNRGDVPRSRFPHFFNLVPFLLIFGLSTSLKFSEDISQFERERKERENENLKSELALLRSQISPHFMFNVLNSLAAMARKKSEHIEEAIINLSQLMRYMLYESSVEKTTLGEELDYLNNYIDLHRLRFGDLVAVRIEKGSVNEQSPIEPMLLIPFVENAFKHGVGLIQQPEIVISVASGEHTIDFAVKNKFVELPQGKDRTPGIGLQNVKRRLELLYPGKFTLNIHKDGDWFMAHLLLKTTA